MYTVCWTDSDKAIDRWERCESRREVAALLIREGLENDEDVLIFSPEAEDCLLTPEAIFAAL